MEDKGNLKAWSTLSPKEQLRLRVAFGQAVDRHPQMRLCGLAEKNRLFADFLIEHGILWSDRG